MARKRKRSITFLRWAILVLVLMGGLFWACNLWVTMSTRGRVYESVKRIEAKPVGVVLGTSKKLSPRRGNPHFEHRMRAAADLYHAGKVRHLLVSGDRDSQYYNEPRDMTEKLVSLGVPPTAITADYAGYRTLDSIVRAHRVFGLDQLVVISDDFHVNRALFIARKEGIDAVALRSKPVELRLSFKTRLREYFARVKAVLDLYLFGTEPESLDEPVEILVGPSAPAPAVQAMPWAVSLGC